MFRVLAISFLVFVVFFSNSRIVLSQTSPPDSGSWRTAPPGMCYVLQGDYCSFYFASSCSMEVEEDPDWQIVGGHCGRINYPDNETDPELLSEIATTTISGFQNGREHYVKCGITKSCQLAITGVDGFGQPVYRCATVSPMAIRFYGQRSEVSTTTCVGDFSEIP